MTTKYVLAGSVDPAIDDLADAINYWTAQGNPHIDYFPRRGWAFIRRERRVGPFYETRAEALAAAQAKGIWL